MSKKLRALPGIKMPKGFTPYRAKSMAPLVHKVQLRYAEEEALRIIADRICGDKKWEIAKFHMDFSGRYPRATLPESITAYLLEKRFILYNYQQSVNLGRTRLGGGVIDFWLPERGIALSVIGVIWHSIPGAIEKDEQVMAATMNSIIEGVAVTAYIHLFDEDLYACSRDDTINLALSGIELPRVITPIPNPFL